MPVHALATAAGKYGTTEQYGLVFATILALGFVHRWAQGTSLLAREERLEGAQLRTAAATEQASATAGLTAVGGRVVMVATNVQTGAMSPLGLVTIASLAQQGAHIIALVPDASSPDVVQMILLLRESASSENIFAETCDVADLESVSAFAKLWNEGVQAGAAPGAPTAAAAPGARAAAAPPAGAAPGTAASNPLFGTPAAQALRLDMILFLPSDEAAYKIGESLRGSPSMGEGRPTMEAGSGDAAGADAARATEAPSADTPADSTRAADMPANDANVERGYAYDVLGRFHLVNAMLPSLLIMPPSRDIRIVSVISPWYAAGIGEFDSVAAPVTAATRKHLYHPWSRMGATSMRWLVLATEMQRRLDLLAAADTRSRSKLPGLDPAAPAIPVKALHEGAPRRSHISSILVCPGFERTSQLLPFFGIVRPWREHTVHSLILLVLMFALYPFFWVFGRSTSRGADAVVWATTARLESEYTSIRRMQAALRPDAQPSPGADVFDPRTWLGMQPGVMYRDGRVNRIPLPERIERDADAASALWEETEKQVQEVLGSIHRPQGEGEPCEGGVPA
ncbi:hypothetical protein MSPP1_001966 [Malassezia sp. CBS 17886]|nr:hypothetical protein MSPP1_001966 [Malassezia sp. CBS 17886]